VLNCTDFRQRLPYAVGQESAGGSVRVVNARRLAHETGEIAMLYSLAVILLIAWFLGIAGIYTIGAFVHVLLVVALVLFVVGLLGGRRALA
jgi:Family of unknown function (DUF5670)